MTGSKILLCATSTVLFACCVPVPALCGSLVPVSDLNLPSGTASSQPLGPAFVPTGSDPLQNGTTSFSRDGTVHVDLQGASPNQSYSAYFCRFGFGPAGCVLLGQAGALSTDGNGNGHAALAFPAVTEPEDYAGLVLITRSISSATTYEYVGAAHVAVNMAAEPHFNIQGQISFISPSGASFVISPLNQTITTNGSTKFQGKVSSFGELTDGLQVDVQGVIMSNGTLLATSVKAH